MKTIGELLDAVFKKGSSVNKVNLGQLIMHALQYNSCRRNNGHKLDNQSPIDRMNAQYWCDRINQKIQKCTFIQTESPVEHFRTKWECTCYNSNHQDSSTQVAVSLKQLFTSSSLSQVELVGTAFVRITYRSCCCWSCHELCAWVVSTKKRFLRLVFRWN